MTPVTPFEASNGQPEVDPETKPSSLRWRPLHLDSRLATGRPPSS